MLPDNKKDRTRLASGPCWAAAVFRVHSAPLKPLSMAAGRWHMFAHEDGRCQSNSKKHSACRMLLAEAGLDNSLGSGGPGEVGPGWPGGRAQGGPGRWAQGGLGSRVVQPGFSMQHAACRMHVDRKLAFRALFLVSFSLSNCSHLFSFLFPPPWLKPSCSPLCWSFCLSFFFAFCIYIFPEKVLLRSAHESGNARRADLASP